MARNDPARELRIGVKKSDGTIEIFALSDGNAVYSIVFTIDQAEKHAMQLIEAIEIARSAQGMPKRSGLVLPGAPALN